MTQFWIKECDSCYSEVTPVWHIVVFSSSSNQRRYCRGWWCTKIYDVWNGLQKRLKENGMIVEVGLISFWLIVHKGFLQTYKYVSVWTWGLAVLLLRCLKMFTYCKLTLPLEFLNSTTPLPSSPPSSPSFSYFYDCHPSLSLPASQSLTLWSWSAPCDLLLWVFPITTWLWYRFLDFPRPAHMHQDSPNSCQAVFLSSSLYLYL